jgi:hypothetical protein
LLGQLRWLHAVHRTRLEIPFGHRPLEEGVQAAVAVVGRRWLPAGELVGDVRLEVLTPELAGEERLAMGLAVGGEQPDGVVEASMVLGLLFSASRVRRKLRLRTRR